MRDSSNGSGEGPSTKGASLKLRSPFGNEGDAVFDRREPDPSLYRIVSGRAPGSLARGTGCSDSCDLIRGNEVAGEGSSYSGSCW